MVGILRKTERAMVRAMCGAKLANRESAEDMMDMLGLNQTIASGVRWLGHVLTKEDRDVIRNALEFNVEGQRKRGRPKRTQRKQVEEERLKADLNLKDAHNRTNWKERKCVCVCNFHEVIPATSIKWGQQQIMASSSIY